MGNLDAKRDWGHAKEYVEGMWRILQQESPDDYVLATGITTTVRDFATWAFEDVGIEIEWRGHEADEKGYCSVSGKCFIEIDPRYYRPTEVDLLLGDPTKAEQQLGWTAKVKVRELVREMVKSDLQIMQAVKTAKVD